MSTCETTVFFAAPESETTVFFAPPESRDDRELKSWAERLLEEPGLRSRDVREAAERGLKDGDEAALRRFVERVRAARDGYLPPLESIFDLPSTDLGQPVDDLPYGREVAFLFDKAIGCGSDSMMRRLLPLEPLCIVEARSQLRLSSNGSRTVACRRGYFAAVELLDAYLAAGSWATYLRETNERHTMALLAVLRCRDRRRPVDVGKLQPLVDLPRDVFHEVVRFWYGGPKWRLDRRDAGLLRWAALEAPEDPS